MPKGRMEEVKLVGTTDEANLLLGEGWVLFSTEAKPGGGTIGVWFVMAKHAYELPQP